MSWVRRECMEKKHFTCQQGYGRDVPRSISAETPCRQYGRPAARHRAELVWHWEAQVSAPDDANQLTVLETVAWKVVAEMHVNTNLSQGNQTQDAPHFSVVIV